MLFSKSGYGKSSLLNAGVIPRLTEKELATVINIRLNEAQLSPIEMVEHQLSAQSAAGTFLDHKLPPAAHTGDISALLWFQCKKIYAANPTQRAIVLIFDQFEELFGFTAQQIAEFSRVIAAIHNLDMPPAVRETIKDKMKSTPNFFTEHETNLLFEPLNLKIVFSLRSDRLSLLNQLKINLPAIFKKTYELQPLDEIQALDAMLEPAAKEGNFISPRFTYNDAALRLILDSLKDSQNQRIETFQLQLICHHAEQLIVSKQEQNPHIEKLTLTAEEVGDPSEIYKNHYYNLISSINLEERLPARLLIEDNLIVGTSRVPLPEEVIYERHNIPAELLKMLVDKRLLRGEPNTVGGISYEISHDTLVAPILEARRIRLEKEEEERTERERQEEQRLAAEKAERERIEKERIVKQQRKIILIVSIAAVISLLLATFAFLQMQRANKANSAIENANKELSNLLELTDASKKQAEDALKALEEKQKQERKLKYEKFYNEAVNLRDKADYDNAIKQFTVAKEFAEDTLKILNEIKDCNLLKTKGKEFLQILEQAGKYAKVANFEQAISSYRKALTYGIAHERIKSELIDLKQNAQNQAAALTNVAGSSGFDANVKELKLKEAKKFEAYSKEIEKLIGN